MGSSATWRYGIHFGKGYKLTGNEKMFGIFKNLAIFKLAYSVQWYEEGEINI